jgi:hypothetical protein
MVKSDVKPDWKITWSEVHDRDGVLPAVDAGLHDLWNYGRAEAERHHKKRKLMARLVYDLGIPAAMFAAIAGATAAADIPAWIPTVFALSASVLSATVAVVGPVEGRIDHGTKEAEYSHFAQGVYTTRLRLNGAPPEEQIAALKALADERLQLDLRAPIRGGAPAARLETDNEPARDAL